mgnify:FL=1
MSVTVEIPMALPSVANGSHGHWSTRAKRVKAQRHATLMMLQVNQGRINSLGGFAGAALVVTLTRVSPRSLDSDNLAYAFKAVRDEVAAYFGVNDNDPRIVWKYAQERGKPASVRITFDVAATQDHDGGCVCDDCCAAIQAAAKESGF